MVFTCGYSGGFGGSEYADDIEAIPGVTGIRQIDFRYGALLDFYQLTLATASGPVTLPSHGGGGGDKKFQIVLDADEFMTGMYGRYGQAVDVISKITTNKRTFDSQIGGTGGPANFSYEAPDGTEIIGFTGRSAVVNDAIGVLLRNRQ